jgi:hypothetical protein
MTEGDMMKEIGEIVEELGETERKIQELKRRVMMLKSPKTEADHENELRRSSFACASEDAQDKRVMRSMVK